MESGALLINNNVSSIGFDQTVRRGVCGFAHGSATREETCLFIVRVGPLHRNSGTFGAFGHKSTSKGELGSLSCLDKVFFYKYFVANALSIHSPSQPRPSSSTLVSGISQIVWLTVNTTLSTAPITTLAI